MNTVFKNNENVVLQTNEIANNRPIAEDLHAEQDDRKLKNKNMSHNGNAKIVKIICKTLLYALLIAFALLMIFPYFWMLMTSFKDDYEAMSSLTITIFPKKWIFSNYKELWNTVPFLAGLFNTVKVEVSVIVIGTFVSALAAFSFAKLRLRHRTFWLLLLMSGMMVPYAALMMPQYRAFQAVGMINTLWPLILPGFFGNVSMIFFLVQYMRGVPTALIEAGKIDGAGYMRIFITIMLPTIKTAIAAQVVFWFMGIWNDYFAPAIYLTDYKSMTLQPMLARINSNNSGGTNLPLIMAGSVISSIPMFIVYVACQKYFIESLAISGVKG